MLSTTLKNFYPSDWVSTTTESHKYKEFTLTSSSQKYEELKDDMASFATRINEIKRVENPYLYSCFLLKQAEYKSRGIIFNLKQLYHDTGEDKVDSILSTNLDWRLVRRSKFGTGVSFSPCTTYANKYSSMYNGRDRAMIVADVIVGSCETRSYGCSLPTESYDTTTGNNRKVYVKFYDDEFYPKYVIYYESIEHVKRPRYSFIDDWDF